MRTKSLILFLLACCQLSVAQIHEEGLPVSYNHVDVMDDIGIMTINLDVPIINDLHIEDVGESRSDAIWRDAVAVPVDVGNGIAGLGTWYDLGNLGKVWKLRLKANGALSMEINFDQFSLPNGATLYIYNPEHTEHVGGYTSANNKVFSKLSTHMIQGDDCIVEYYEPNEVAGSGVLHIQDVTFRYRDILRLDDGGGSQACEVDINCAEGNTWSGLANSVVRIRSRIGDDFFWSTGTLVNNTALDCKPYILSSYRTTVNPYNLSNSSFIDYQYYRFYFDYERSECNEGKGLNRSISGAFMRANSNDAVDGEGSDFILMELSTEIPDSYNVYWAGWNALPNPMAFEGVTIHHPMGDVKKISTYSTVPVSADFGLPNTHWRVLWDETESGHGVTEVGSNGAPLFDEEGRVFGTLTVGGSSCEEELPGGTDNPDFFGKMSYHWIENPNPLQQKLRSWLDPTGSGLSVFEGSINPCAVGISVNSAEVFLNLWPNPANDEIFIEITDHQECTLIITDLAGQIVLSTNVGSNQRPVGRFDVSFLSNGLYHIQCISNSNIGATSKLLISR